MASCFSCGIDYEDPGFVEAVVSDEVWKIIAPNGGLLCIRCIAQRCADHGLSYVPVDLTGMILLSGVTIGTQPIQVVALGDEDIDAEYPNEDGHVGFYATMDDGVPFHVLGDPNMSDETLGALGRLAQAAQKHVEGVEFQRCGECGQIDCLCEEDDYV